MHKKRAGMNNLITNPARMGEDQPEVPGCQWDALKPL
jgi:hypothetical protein